MRKHLILDWRDRRETMELATTTRPVPDHVPMRKARTNAPDPIAIVVSQAVK